MKKSFIILAAVAMAFAACNNEEPVVNNYYIDDNPATVQGQLSGKFSVSPTKKVSFSQGNLQYNAVQNIWRFASNQYDFVGNATKGTVKIGDEMCNNLSISNTYNGWIDLFGWGTGDNPTKASTISSDYATFVDWGMNRIYNGGDKVNLWRTLTKDEWIYLFMGRKDAEKKLAFGHIYLDAGKNDSINGLFILPDTWTKPDDVEFNLSIDNGLEKKTTYYYNSAATNYKHNGYTFEEWAKLEASGVVFLPAPGYRYNAGYSKFNIQGVYWSSTPGAYETAYDMYFTNDRLLDPNAYGVPSAGFLVRLVR